MSPPSEKAEPVRGCTRDQHLQTPTARPPAAAAGMYVPNTAVMGSRLSAFGKDAFPAGPAHVRGRREGRKGFKSLDEW